MAFFKALAVASAVIGIGESILAFGHEQERIEEERRRYLRQLNLDVENKAISLRNQADDLDTRTEEAYQAQSNIEGVARAGALGSFEGTSLQSSIEYERRRIYQEAVKSARQSVQDYSRVRERARSEGAGDGTVSANKFRDETYGFLDDLAPGPVRTRGEAVFDTDSESNSFASQSVFDESVQGVQSKGAAVRRRNRDIGSYEEGKVVTGGSYRGIEGTPIGGNTRRGELER